MKTNKDDNKSTGDLDQLKAEESIHQKLDEFVSHLCGRQWDEEVLKSLQTQFKAALKSASDAASCSNESESGISQIKSDTGLEKIILAGDKTKPAITKNTVYKILSRTVKVIISLLLILLGFGMIIMPAPEYFEMFTLFYFSPEDGVTIMDIVSLIVAFCGVAILLSVSLKSAR